ncbi:hypothetical protein A3J41_01875 [candidate division TM6 bacterium RIFCSPHIGHO2_12_FULL_38_8]|nr:MAG: hypothetical protein A3J41_01875 [candidate division TM6 bacterium RIFCSPHIGHO2_12_FULL_38_8]
MFIKRKISDKILEHAKGYPVVAITGPRQSGKSTLVKQLFPQHIYVTLEDLDIKAKVQADPRGFLMSHGQDQGLIIDEAQQVPELFSYLQGIVDQQKKNGFFVLTGSQNFLLHEKITQSLAGRVALFTLLPLSTQELEEAKKLSATSEDQIKKGFYPKLYDDVTLDVNFLYMTYVATYIERDVRNVLQISDLVAFQKFMKLCAARIGNIINFADLARDCDISPKTAQAWASVLEASYIIKFVHPFYKNFSKRLIKSPKLYFIDSGLACYLLGIKTSQDLFLHEARGAIFESMIMMEIYKIYCNKAENAPIYFWRTAQGQEIDCVMEKSFDQQILVEMKANATWRQEFTSNLYDWENISGRKPVHAYVVYAGNNYFAGDVQAIPWNQMGRMQL